LKFREIYQFVVVIAAVDSVDNRRQPYSRGVAAVGRWCGQLKTTRGGFVDDRGAVVVIHMGGLLSTGFPTAVYAF
jgi:hypothetical protein